MTVHTVNADLLNSTEFLDYDSEIVRDFAHRAIPGGGESMREVERDRRRDSRGRL